MILPLGKLIFAASKINDEEDHENHENFDFIIPRFVVVAAFLMKLLLLQQYV
jgi:hypothetical protein